MTMKENNNENSLTLRGMLIGKSDESIALGKTFIGIDFGTSTTVVSVARYDKKINDIEVNPIRIAQKSEDGTSIEDEKVDSVIAFYNGKILVGKGASNLKYTLEKGRNIWWAFKMELGEDWGSKYYKSDLKAKKYVITNPKDCARIFFQYLKHFIEEYCRNQGLSSNILYAVSIPASFEANQRKDLMDALSDNEMNLSTQSLIDEPNAAFLSYVWASQRSSRPLKLSPNYNPKVLVFDFGGGTCDISILEIGKSYDGMFSKNLAISKFMHLGGTDIDRYITYHYIMPRFLKHNGKKESDFLTKDKKTIAERLYKIAEQLKILISKNLSNRLDNFKLSDELKQSNDGITLTNRVVIDTAEGVLFQENFELRYNEMTESMNVFTRGAFDSDKDLLINIDKDLYATNIKGEEPYNSIVDSIRSAIRKANIPKNEIDYVLLIGGSSQNPYIQEALKTFFEDSKLLVPSDLQTHVSQGAAIHSLLMNGFGKSIIRPITSEPILLITKDVTPRVLVPAGTNIPTTTININDLAIDGENQNVIELPICVGSKGKILSNIKITSVDGCPFPPNAKVCLQLKINVDKLLEVSAMCNGVYCMAEPQNPFANKELTTEERIVKVAERNCNIAAEKNGGIPTKQGLSDLKDAYEKAQNDLMVAETYEEMYRLYPSSCSLNNLGVCYSNAGNEEKAKKFYEMAINEDPTFYAYFNLGDTLRYSDPVRAKELIQKANELCPNDGPTLILLADFAEEDGNVDVARKYRLQVYEQYSKRKSLRLFEYGWYARVAEDLGYYDKAREIRNSKPRLEQESYYDANNLVRTKTNNNEIDLM